MGADKIGEDLQTVGDDICLFGREGLDKGLRGGGGHGRGAGCSDVGDDGLEAKKSNVSLLLLLGGGNSLDEIGGDGGNLVGLDFVDE